MATVDANGSIHYIHTDHLGTPRAVTEPDGDVVWRWLASPFGKGKPDEDANGDGSIFTLNLRFAGQYYDAETGRHYNYFRDYDPAIGRYTTPDPIGLAGGDVNLYGYAANNPLHFVDPSGMIFINVGAGAIGAGIGGVTAGVTAAFQGGSLGDVASATAIGAVAGAATGVTLGAAGTITIGAASSGLGSTAGQMITTGSVDSGGVALSTVAGAAGGSFGVLARMGGQSATTQAMTSSLATAETQAMFDLGVALNEAHPGNESGMCN